MTQFLLALSVVIALTLTSFLVGLAFPSYLLLKKFKDGTEAVLITYDKIDGKMQILDDKKFTYEAFDKK